MIAYQDPDHHGNGPEHHTGKTCIERGCEEPAGTWWSPFWCFRHNVERMDRINGFFESEAERYEHARRAGIRE